MPPQDLLDIAPEVADALAAGQATVALESTVIAHGLPYPANVETTQAMLAAVRAAGAVPALIAIAEGRIRVGAGDTLLERLAAAPEVAKVSRADLAPVLAGGGLGATTVAGTMICAALAGIRVFATGGIGGVHRDAQATMDVSADLHELARTPVAVVCSGAKSILDLPATLEVLETLGVPVIGYGTDRFPAFYQQATDLPLRARADGPAEAAAMLAAQRQLGMGGALVAVPVPAAHALPTETVETWTKLAVHEAATAGIRGGALTPYLLRRVAALSGGQTLGANRALLVNNARVAGEIAAALAIQGRP
ncbi:MAG: pseudouridine-5'-phosphate glycosidase [Alphaproteobacteria bacterium]